MKRCGSSGGGGAAWDVEPERCLLAGTVFLGAIVVTDGSKSEKKKMAHKKNRRRWGTQKWVEGKKWPSRVFKEAGIRVASPQRRHAMQRRSVVHYGKGLVSQWRRELRSCRQEGVVPGLQRRSGLLRNRPEGSPKKYYPPQRRVLCHGGPESMGTVFLPSTFKVYHVIKIKYG